MVFKKTIPLLLFKTSANLRTEVSRYYLNYLWWIIDPVLTMATFYVVFGIFLNRGIPHFVAFLLIGLTAWNWFARSVQHSANSILQGRGLMMQVDIPKIFFPLEIFLRDTFKHLFVVVLLLVFLVFYPTPVSETWVALPVLMIAQAALILSISIICAMVVPFVQDLSFVIGTGIQLMFFGSGIFYRIEDVVLPEHQHILYLNPMAGLLKEYRNVLMYSTWPDWVYIGKIFLVSCLLLVFAVYMLRKLDYIYPRISQQ